MKLQETD